MNKKLALSTIVIPFYGKIKWVPISLLRHIYKQDIPFLKRLGHFLKLAQKSRDARVLSIGEMLAYNMGKLGTVFLSWVACFILLINDEENLDKVESIDLTIGGPSRETRDPPSDVAKPSQEATWGSFAYPMG